MVYSPAKCNKKV